MILYACLPFLSSSQDQLSNLPTFYITTEKNISSKEYYVDGHLQVVAGSETPGIYEGPIRIRGRGNSTWSLSKKPYRIKLDQKFRILGMTAKENDWVLLANHADKTLVRNALAFEVSQACGIYYTPDYRFVDVVLNGSYIGNYMLTDQVERDKDRVNTEKMDIEGDDPNLSGGYLLEIDGFGNTYSYNKDKGEKFPEAFSSAIGNTITIKYPDNDTITTAHRQYIIEHYNAFEQSILNYNQTQAAYDNICRYLDTTAFVKWYVVNELIANPDGVWSLFMKKHRDDDRFYFGPMWDNDISFGNCQRIYSLANDGRSESIMNKCFSNHRVKELINKVLSIPKIRKMIADYWTSFDSQLLKEDLIHLLYNMEEELNVSQSLNYQKWSNALSTRVYDEIYYGANTTYAMQMDYLRNYLSDRIDFLDTFFAAMGNDIPVDPPLPEFDTVQYFHPEPYVWYQLQCQINSKYLVCEKVDQGYELGFTYDPQTAGNWAKFALSCSKDEHNRSIYYLRNKAVNAHVYITAAQAKIPLDPLNKSAFTLYPSPNQEGYYGLQLVSDQSSLNELGIDANGNVVSWSTANKKGQREYRFIPDRAYFQSVYSSTDSLQARWSRAENWTADIPNAYATAVIAEGAKLEITEEEHIQIDSLILLPGSQVSNSGQIQARVSLFCANDSTAASFSEEESSQLISERLLHYYFDQGERWHALSFPLDVKSVRNQRMNILQAGRDYFMMAYQASEQGFDSLSYSASLRPKAGPYLFAVSHEYEKQALIFVFDTKSSYHIEANKILFLGNTRFATSPLSEAPIYFLKDHSHFVLHDDQESLLLPAFHAYLSIEANGELPDSMDIYHLNINPDDTLALAENLQRDLVLIARSGLLDVYNMESEQDYQVYLPDGRLFLRSKAMHNPEQLVLGRGLYFFRYKNKLYKILIH